MSQDLRTQKTRTTTEDSLIRLLQCYPFQEITVRMLIEDCRINRSTFYRNYEDKYALIAQIAQRLLDEYRAVLRPEFIVEQELDEERLQSCFRPLVRFFSENREMLSVMRARELPVDLFGDMLALYAQRLLEVLKRHYCLKEPDITMAAYFSRIIASNILTAILWWHEDGSRKEEPELLQLIATTVTKGIFQSMEQQFQKG